MVGTWKAPKNVGRCLHRGQLTTAVPPGDSVTSEQPARALEGDSEKVVFRVFAN